VVETIPSLINTLGCAVMVSQDQESVTDQFMVDHCYCAWVVHYKFEHYNEFKLYRFPLKVMKSYIIFSNPFSIQQLLFQMNVLLECSALCLDH